MNKDKHIHLTVVTFGFIKVFAVISKTPAGAAAVMKVASAANNMRSGPYEKGGELLRVLQMQ